MRDGGLHFRVMLCGRGLRTTHTHRPITTFLTAKLQLYFIYAAYYRKFFLFRYLLCFFIQLSAFTNASIQGATSSSLRFCG